MRYVDGYVLPFYQIERGAKLSGLPREVREGIRQDTRKHTWVALEFMQEKYSKLKIRFPS